MQRLLLSMKSATAPDAGISKQSFIAHLLSSEDVVTPISGSLPHLARMPDDAHLVAITRKPHPPCL
jgi:hypothetical protein